MPLLTIATFVPIAGGLLLMALPDRSVRMAHGLSIGVTGLTFLITLAIWARGIVPALPRSRRSPGFPPSEPPIDWGWTG